MAEKSYYWLKLKKDFFKRHDIRIVEEMPNGKEYILFYLKLLVESVDHEGMLRFSDEIPYNEQMLATITNTNVDIVRTAIQVFANLGMMDKLDDNSFYMNQVEKMIGATEQDEHTRESTRNRVKAYRERKKLESSQKLDEDITNQDRYSNVTVTLQECYGNVTCNGELDIEKELDIEIEQDKEIELDNLKPPLPPLWDFEKHTNKDNLSHLIDLNEEPYQEMQRDHSYVAERLMEWMEYKDGRKPKSSNHYGSERSIRTLVTKVLKSCEEYGDGAVNDMIDQTIANNYQGIVWDYLKKQQGKSKKIDWRNA